MATLQESLPDAVRLDMRAGVLALDWPEGTSDVIPFRTLRMRCMCAACRSFRSSGTLPEAGASIRVVAIQPYGANAVQLMFSDGHDRGIFPFVYLRTLADEAAASTTTG